MATKIKTGLTIRVSPKKKKSKPLIRVSSKYFKGNPRRANLV